MKRIPSLDGLRAASIGLVVLGHLATRGHAPEMWENYSNLGVRVFFVISGYLITSILLREHARTGGISLKEFYIRRSFRIFPAAFFFMAVITVVNWPALHWYQITLAVLYLANFGLSYQSWVFGHLWSLSVEEQFYFLWPVVLRRFHRRRTLILIVVTAAAPFYQTCLHFLKIHNDGYGTLPAVANNIAAGCLLAIFAPRLPKIPKLAAAGMLLVLVFVPLFSCETRARTLVALFILQPILHFSIAGLLLHVVQHPYSIFNWSPITWLGRISYSLYLWQQPFCYSPSLRSAFVTVLALACAVGSYYLIEQPMLRLRDKRASLVPQGWGGKVPEPAAAA